VSRLQNFHVMFFAITMGLSGFVIAYEKINAIFQISDFLFVVLRLLVSAIFIVIVTLYTTKVLKFKEAFKKEISHPIKINFFATIPISSLLLSIVWKGTALYMPLYVFGIVVLTFATFYTISFWIKNSILINHSNPAWFIPIVGNLIVVIAAKENAGYLWYYLSIGVFFYIVLFGIIFYRILFHDQLPSKFIPTMFIMIAPPAVGFLGYVKMTGNFDPFAHVLISLTIFFTLLLIFMYKSFLKLKFFLSWWAFTFPVAAATIAFLKAYELVGANFFLYIGVATFIGLIVILSIVSYFTIINISKKEICVEE